VLEKLLKTHATMFQAREYNQKLKFLRILFVFLRNLFFLSENGAKNGLKSKRLVRGGAGGKVMRENKPVLLVLSAYDGEILSEKRHLRLCWLLPIDCLPT
jgi:hypothetical protein